MPGPGTYSPVRMGTTRENLAGSSAFKSKLAHVANDPDEYRIHGLYLCDVVNFLHKCPKHKLAPLRDELERIRKIDELDLLHRSVNELLTAMDLAGVA